MTVHPHVFFSGNCREAMTRYQEVLGGDLDVAVHADAPPDARMPGAPPDAVVNAALVLDGGVLLASGPDRRRCTSTGGGDPPHRRQPEEQPVAVQLPPAQ